MIEFEKLLQKVRKNGIIPHVLMALDPGNTTGVAIFIDGQLHDGLQINTIDGEKLQWANMEALFKTFKPDHVICEDYRIYAHKLSQHTFSSVPTLRLIGGIDLYCYQHNIPIAYQMALVHKKFCTDRKLQKWGFWKKGQKHCRDAIRAGCYSLLFTKWKE